MLLIDDDEYNVCCATEDGALRADLVLVLERITGCCVCVCILRYCHPQSHQIAFWPTVYFLSGFKGVVCGNGVTAPQLVSLASTAINGGLAVRDKDGAGGSGGGGSISSSTPAVAGTGYNAGFNDYDDLAYSVPKLQPIIRYDILLYCQNGA